MSLMWAWASSLVIGFMSALLTSPQHVAVLEDAVRVEAVLQLLHAGRVLGPVGSSDRRRALVCGAEEVVETAGGVPRRERVDDAAARCRDLLGEAGAGGAEDEQAERAVATRHRVGHRRRPAERPAHVPDLGEDQRYVDIGPGRGDESVDGLGRERSEQSTVVPGGLRLDRVEMDRVGL